MATRQELIDQALAHMKRAKWSPHQWAAAVQNGYPRGKRYAYEGTPNMLAQQALYDAVHAEEPAPPPTPPTPPPPSGVASLAQSIVFCAQRSEAALAAPPRFKVALTADPAYAQWATPSIVAQFRAQGRKVAVWGVQTQISPQTIRDCANRLNADYIIWQAETSEEYRTAIAEGARVIVGNANAWTQAQRDDATARINRGELAFAQETYTNLGAPWPKDSSAGGVPAASYVLGCYDGTNEQPGKGWHPSVAAYKQNTPAAAWPNVCVYHAAALSDDDWRALA